MSGFRLFLLVAASLSLTSCSLLKVPARLLHAVGRTVGINAESTEVSRPLEAPVFREVR